MGGLPRFETIQNGYSLLNRRFEDALSEVCTKEDISLLPYSPLAGGVLSGKYQDGARPEGARFTSYESHNPRTQMMTKRFINDGTLRSTGLFMKVAADAGLTPAALAVAWTLSRPYVGSTIIGATSVAQVEESLAAAQLKLSDEVLAACDAVSKEIPYPMG